MAHSFVGRSRRVLTRFTAPPRMGGFLRPAVHARHPALTRGHVRSQENTRRITQRNRPSNTTIGHHILYIMRTNLRIALPLRLVHSDCWVRSCWSRHRLLRPSILVRIQGQLGTPRSAWHSGSRVKQIVIVAMLSASGIMRGIPSRNAD